MQRAVSVSLAAAAGRSLGFRRRPRPPQPQPHRGHSQARAARPLSPSPSPREGGPQRELLDRIIRVDQAGEFGANRIYAGQMSVLGRTALGPVIQRMWNQEKEHLAKFNEMMIDQRVRPTVLMPFWNVAGFALGAGSALLGKEAAMACTVAIEESISHHYNNQIRTLMEEDSEKHKELLDILKKFRDEEMEHHDTGLEHDAELAPAYTVLKTAIQIGCKAAIYLSERI